MFWITPPDPLLLLPPSHVTDNQPNETVLFNRMPGTDAPFDEMLRKLNPLAPIMVFSMRNAVAVVVASVLLAPITLTAPLVLANALNALLAAVFRFTPLLKLTVVFVLLDIVTPVPVPFTGPLNVTEPPV